MFLGCCSFKWKVSKVRRIHAIVCRILIYPVSTWRGSYYPQLKTIQCECKISDTRWKLQFNCTSKVPCYPLLFCVSKVIVTGWCPLWMRSTVYHTLFFVIQTCIWNKCGEEAGELGSYAVRFNYWKEMMFSFMQLLEYKGHDTVSN